MSDLPCAGGKTIVLPFGDSITAGANSTDTGGYRSPLFHLAHANGHDPLFVGGMENGPATVDGVAFSNHHEGHPGYKIDVSGSSDWYGITPMVEGVMSTQHPEIILLMIGTNDVLQSYDLAEAPNRLAILLDKIITAAPDACLVVAMATPLSDDAGDAQIQEYNSHIPGLVSSRASDGKHIGWVDMHSAFTANANYETDYLADGIHPKDAGYALMASTWYDAIQGLLD
ncbi:MAG TPA: SGNH/GDSL hydrolase family protein [Polyangiaceae bacterium]|jgi:lysophospholipase L1-like esterase|nr:SGNH/GDSL hydrolase family protein [Polyangiaceae bacterium]